MCDPDATDQPWPKARPPASSTGSLKRPDEKYVDPNAAYDKSEVRSFGDHRARNPWRLGLNLKKRIGPPNVGDIGEFRSRPPHTPA